MKSVQNFTTIIEKEDDMDVALCPELDIASQGHTVAEAKKNLQEAIELFLACASKKEITLSRKNNFSIKNPQMPISNFTHSGFLNL